MPKLSCSNCLKYKKGKFFPFSQPYTDRKICDKCLTKNKKTNDDMINMLKKKTKQQISNEEESKINLSIDALHEMKEKTRNNPDSQNIMKQLCMCTDDDLIREQLNKLNINSSVLDELVNHCVTVANINLRVKETNNKETNNKETNNKETNNKETNIEDEFTIINAEDLL